MGAEVVNFCRKRNREGAGVGRCGMEIRCNPRIWVLCLMGFGSQDNANAVNALFACFFWMIHILNVCVCACLFVVCSWNFLISAAEGIQEIRNNFDKENNPRPRPDHSCNQTFGYFLAFLLGFFSCIQLFGQKLHDFNINKFSFFDILSHPLECTKWSLLLMYFEVFFALLF